MYGSIVMSEIVIFNDHHSQIWQGSDSHLAFGARQKSKYLSKWRQDFREKG